MSSRAGSGTSNWVSCACGKRAWIHRSSARKVAKLTDHAKSMSTYQCALSGLWHIGHKPEAVRRDRIARADITSPDKRQNGAA
jgi:hypothetical protein